jgi:hypothetical protein
MNKSRDPGIKSPQPASTPPGPIRAATPLAGSIRDSLALSGQAAKGADLDQEGRTADQGQRRGEIGYVLCLPRAFSRKRGRPLPKKIANRRRIADGKVAEQI